MHEATQKPEVERQKRKASKSLVERLSLQRAEALGIEPDHVRYIRLADLPTATEKASRDAPAIAVCEL